MVQVQCTGRFGGYCESPQPPLKKKNIVPQKKDKSGNFKIEEVWMVRQSPFIAQYVFMDFDVAMLEETNFPCPLNCDVSHRRTNQKHNLQ